MKYQRKTKEVVDVIKYTGSINAELIKFLGRSNLFFTRCHKLYIYDENNRGKQVIPGLYIVKFPNGLFGLYEEFEFNILFEQFRPDQENQN